ncbi:hypothetical protein OEZ86_006288 [Tetradesmus obliquus]|nr:hypothetical protein OEZ86_006288 [Tetradesmus obliquus]
MLGLLRVHWSCNILLHRTQQLLQCLQVDKTPPPLLAAAAAAAAGAAVAELPRLVHMSGSCSTRLALCRRRTTSKLLRRSGKVLLKLPPQRPAGRAHQRCRRCSRP